MEQHDSFGVKFLCISWVQVQYSLSFYRSSYHFPQLSSRKWSRHCTVGFSLKPDASYDWTQYYLSDEWTQTVSWHCVKVRKAAVSSDGLILCSFITTRCSFNPVILEPVISYASGSERSQSVLLILTVRVLLLFMLSQWKDSATLMEPEFHYTFICLLFQTNMTAMNPISRRGAIIFNWSMPLWYPPTGAFTWFSW